MISIPPAGPVTWQVVDRSGAVLGSVTASTWFAARAAACLAYSREPGQIRLTSPRDLPASPRPEPHHGPIDPVDDAQHVQSTLPLTGAPTRTTP
jgi:hypothetical protein